MIGRLQDFRALVTGAAGFLGSQLAFELVRHGADVMGIDLNPAPFSKSNFRNFLGEYRHAAGQYRFHKYAAENFLKFSPKHKRMIFHMAGMADAGLCEEYPARAFEINVNLTLEVLESIRRIDGGKLLFPSTGLVYGRYGNHPFTEEDSVVADSKYAATKIEAEEHIKTYTQDYAFGAIIARLNNVYGPNVSSRTVIGQILSQVSRQEPICVLDEKPVRDFIFSGDVVEALIRLVSVVPESGADIVNVSTGFGTSIGKVVSDAARVFGFKSLGPEQKPNRAQQTSYLVLANNKLKTLTSWSPTTTIAEGLQKSLVGIEAEDGKK